MCDSITGRRISTDSTTGNEAVDSQEKALRQATIRRMEAHADRECERVLNGKAFAGRCRIYNFRVDYEITLEAHECADGLWRYRRV